MALSNDLINQLVKATKPETPKNTEATVYGEVTVVDGKKYVKLDGSDDLLTPVETTTNVQNGERVTVMIKDHTATVTGNISSPAARTQEVEDVNTKVDNFGIIVADKVSTGQLAAEKATIEELISDNLTATNAKFDSLDSKYATITELEATDAKIENLDSTYATIEKLEADYVTADVIDSTYATIENLEATNADIHNLDATYADITDATIKRVEANEANISKLDATYADITDATIERVKANEANINQLDADVGDINTLIYGSATGDTIHTNFANAVIAQLGNAQIKSAMIDNVSASKITAGDIITNNVQVKSEDGNLIISDETIQISDESIVRVQIGKDGNNDYSINVWDSEGNLMFSEGGITDNAIKDAIIRNDMVSENANISASKLNISSLFEEINGSEKTIKSSKIYFDDKEQTLDVAFTEMTDDVKSQGTQLSVVKGQIDSKVWKQDIIGKNLIKNSNFSNGLNLWVAVGVTASVVNDSTHGKCLKITSNAVGSPSQMVYPDTVNNFIHSGGSYALSFYARADEECVLQSNVGGSETAERNKTIGTTWQRFTEVYTANHSSITFWLTEPNKTVYITKIKMEKGDIVTDWTSAPEDTDSAITTFRTQYSSINQTINNISSTVASHTSNISELSTEVSDVKTAIEQTNESISLKANKTDVETAINSTVKSVNTEYRLSTSSTSLAGNYEWSTTAPTWIDGKYMWSRTITILSDDTRNEGTPTCISGATGAVGPQGPKGDTGATGRQGPKGDTGDVGPQGLKGDTGSEGTGVVSVTAQYYLSTSKTSLTGDSWADTAPTWIEGRYLWTRSKIVYKNPTSTEYTDPVCDSTWDNFYTKSQTDAKFQITNDSIKSTVEMLDVSGRNLIVRRGERVDTYVDPSGNIIDADVNYKSATMDDSIRVEPGATYVLSKSESASQYYFRWAWYDEDMRVIARDAQNGSQTVWVAPDNAAYVRISYPYIDGANPKMEKGEIATGYCPAIEDMSSAIDKVDSKFDNYSTTTQMNSAIDQKADSITSTVNAKFSDYSTTAQMNSAIDQKANSITSTVASTYTTKTEFNNLYIGGRNLIKNSDFSNLTNYWVITGVTASVEEDATHGTCLKITSSDIGSSTHRIYQDTGNNFKHQGGWYALSYYAKADSSCTIQSNVAGSNSTNRNHALTTNWQRFTEIYTADSGSVSFWLTEANKTAYITKIKMENGNKVTDWIPAPEDVDSDIANVQDSVNVTGDFTSGLSERLATAESTIQQLENCINMLVLNDEGATLFDQTTDGWTFNIASAQGEVAAVKEILAALQENLTGTSADIIQLQNAIKDINAKTEYVHIGTYTNESTGNEEPSIELGEGDSNYKAVITNTRILFYEGSDTPVRIHDHTLFAEKAVIENEFRQGNFVDKVRENGNKGLFWEVSS